MPPSGCAAWRNRLYVVSSRPSQEGAIGGLCCTRGTVPIARPHSPPIKGGRICRSCTCTPYVPIAPCHKRGGRCGGLCCMYTVARPHPPEAERTAEQIVFLILFYI